MTRGNDAAYRQLYPYSHPRTPQKVRRWLAQRPDWLELRATAPVSDLPFPQFGAGERSAIAVAHKVHADLVLMDDRQGVAIARADGLAIMGTLGVDDLAARRGLLDLAKAFANLQKTKLRCRPTLFDEVLAEFDASTTNFQNEL